MKGYGYINDKTPKYLTVLKRILILLVESALVVLVAWLITRFALIKTIMVGDSMANTINDRDVLLINKLAYMKKGPQRNDVIVFNLGGDEHTYYNVKRVIGVPGDTIQIFDGKIYVNGSPLKEEIVVEKIRVAGLAEEPIELIDDEYFVLGDNRNSSEDSRFSSIGMIVKGDIIGKAVFRISPELALVDKLNLKE